MKEVTKLTTRKTNTLRLTESAILIALATVLSTLKLFDLPMGGSVTPFSMLPIVIVAYRYGFKWGLTTGAAYGFLQMLLGMDNLQYGATFVAVVCIILFDYLVAFIPLSFGALFRDKLGAQSAELTCGVIFGGIGRYICHFITGWQIWGIWAPEGTPAHIYSLTYNASYMIPEITITVAAAILISSVLNFKSTQITTVKNTEAFSATKNILLKTLGVLFCVGGILFDPIIVRTNPETQMLVLILVPIVLVSIGAIFLLISKIMENSAKK